MKIGVVSDTHSFDIPQQLIEELKSVDLIIHAGDFCSLKDVNHFRRLNELKAVYGNMDDAAVRMEFPERRIIELKGVRIGLYHGRGSSKEVLDVVKDEFKKEKVDIVIFGHSHQPLNKSIDGVIYFNPGSPNDMFHADIHTYGLIEIKNKKINAKIIELKHG